MIKVELLKETDIPALAELELLCFPEDAWSKDAFLGEIGNPHSLFLVARDEKNEKVVGYAGAWLVCDAADITTIAVHPDYRREGIGKELLGLLITLCKEKGMAILHLEVRQSNDAARTLYHNAGFMETGLRKGYYGGTEDAVLMSLQLDKIKEG